MLAGALALVLAGSCRGADPRAAVLEERTRFSVDLLSWVLREDGSLVADLRVTGPVTTTLDALTVEVQRYAADGTFLASDWVPIDLTGWTRTGSLEKVVFLPARDGTPENLAVLVHPEPGPEILPRLKELEGIE